MKCPYVVHRQVIRQSKTEYNAEGAPCFYQDIENNKAAFADCLETECGAYNKELKRCDYKGV